MSKPPCARCREKGLPCHFDPDYHRVRNTDRLAELESKLRTIAEGRGMTTAPLDTQGPPGDAASAVMDPTDHDDTAMDVRPATTSTSSDVRMESVHLGSPLATPTSPQVFSIGTVQLSLGQARELFAIYFAKCHHILPFLESTRMPEEYYDLSRVLFWFIVAVASRQYRADLTLLTKLSPFLAELLWKVVVPNPTSLPHIQTLLLMTCWPLPDLHLWTDKTHVLNCIAMTAAMRMGLHRPGREAEYTKLRIHVTEAAMLERTKTWIAAVAESQRLSTDLGHTPLAYMNDYTVHQACRKNATLGIPAELRVYLQIQRCCHQCLYMLSSNYDNPLGLPQEGGDLPYTVGRIEQSLAALQASIEPQLSYINTLRLLYVKLVCQCTYFLYDNMTAQRMTGVLDAYSTASELLTVLVSHPDAQDVLPYAPHSTCFFVFLAAMVVFRVVHSSYAESAVGSGAGAGAMHDRRAAYVLYSAAGLSLCHISAQYKEKDFAARMSETMMDLWRWADEDDELSTKPPRLLVKSRYGYSVFYDSLLIWRRYRVRHHPELRGLQTGENMPESRSDNLPGVPPDAQQDDPPQAPSPTAPNNLALDHTQSIDPSNMYPYDSISGGNAAGPVEDWCLSMMAPMADTGYLDVFE